MPIRHDRRRRVLTDDLSLSTASDDAVDAGGKALSGASGKRYADAAQWENQTRLADLVPMRPLPCVLLFGFGMILIAGLLLAYAWLPQLVAYVPAETLAPLDLAGEHSLATWFASLLLLTNMQLAMLVYSLRRHRVDDYHGRYRIWLAMAAASLVASVDLATGLNGLLKVALAPAARWCGLADHFGVGIALGVVVTYLAIRLILETRRSWGALLTLALAAVCLLLPPLLRNGWLEFDLPENAAMFRVGLHLSGCLLLVAGTTLFGRHVMLDVEGKLPERKAKPPKPAKPKTSKIKLAETAEKEPASATKSASEASTKPRPRTDLDPPARTLPPVRPAAAATPTKPTAAQMSHDEDDEDDSDSSSDMRNLSRAERKRLKREMKLSRRDAA